MESVSIEKLFAKTTKISTRDFMLSAMTLMNSLEGLTPVVHYKWGHTFTTSLHSPNFEILGALHSGILQALGSRTGRGRRIPTRFFFLNVELKNNATLWSFTKTTDLSRSTLNHLRNCGSVAEIMQTLEFLY